LPRPSPDLITRVPQRSYIDAIASKTSKGKYNHARDLTDAEWQAAVSDERIFNSIMNGRNIRGNMPPFGQKLKEDEINSLVSFVRGLKG
jgi:mono/diheme cytochrome c family protein